MFAFVQVDGYQVICSLLHSVLNSIFHQKTHSRWLPNANENDIICTNYIPPVGSIGTRVGLIGTRVGLIGSRVGLISTRVGLISTRVGYVSWITTCWYRQDPTRMGLRSCGI